MHSFCFKMDIVSMILTRSLRAPGGPCTKSMEVLESRMERVNEILYTTLSMLHVDKPCLAYSVFFTPKLIGSEEGYFSSPLQFVPTFREKGQ